LPALDVLAASHTPLPRDDTPLVLRPEMGLHSTLKADEQPVASAVWLQLHEALVQGDIAALQRVCAGVEPALRRQLRALLQYHLNTPQLKSSTVWRELQSYLQAP
jgi:DNA repair protein RecO (recombination protein O)